MTDTLPAADPLQRIRRLSRAMVRACWALMLVLPVALAVYWAVASAPELAVRGNLPAGAIQQPLQSWQRLACAAAMAVPLALLLTGLWHARQCFAQFAAGQVFTDQATRHLRRLAGWVAAAALAAMVAGAVVSVLLTLGNAPGTRQLAVGIGSDHVLTLFFAGLVWLIAEVMDQGQRLARENEQFV
jgi:hypothetical protein